MSQLVVLVRDAAAAPAWTFGLVLACGAAGAFVGTTGARLTRRFGARATLTVATVVEAVALAAMAASMSVAVLAAIWFLAGVPAGVRIPVARSLQQRLTPNHLLGRVNVSSRMFTRGVIVVGAVASGTVAELLGVRTAFVAGGAVVLVAALLTAVALGRGAVPSSTAPPS
jgi:MFS family permease